MRDPGWVARARRVALAPGISSGVLPGTFAVGGQARGRLPISRLPEHSFATSPAVCVAAAPAVPLPRVQFSSDEGLFTAVS